MGGALMLETIALLYWCQKMKLTPPILHGYSLGGHMASLAFTKYNEIFVFLFKKKFFFDFFSVGLVHFLFYHVLLGQQVQQLSVTVYLHVLFHGLF
jgi:hypothetical protein